MFCFIFLLGHSILGTELMAGLCRTDCKKLYSLLRQKNTNVKNASTIEEIEKFWKELFGGGGRFNIMKKLTGSKNQCQQNPRTECSQISEVEVAEVLRTTLNWKAPGRDQTTKFGSSNLHQHTHI